MRGSFLKKSILYLLLFLFSIGVEIEFATLYQLEATTEEFNHLLFGISLLGGAMFPLIILITIVAKKYYTTIYLIPLSLISGWFIPSWIAGFANEYGDQWVNHLTENKMLIETFSYAFIPAIVEEVLKVICSLGLLYSCSKLSDKKSFFLTGICVGLGFQIAEDISYVIQDGIIEGNTILPQVFLRLSGAISSHWMFTGILMVGIYYFSQTKKKAQAVRLIIFPIVFHFLWNSPINDIDLFLPIIPAVLSAMIIFQFIEVYFLMRKEVVLQS